MSVCILYAKSITVAPLGNSITSPLRVYTYILLENISCLTLSIKSESLSIPAFKSLKVLKN